MKVGDDKKKIFSFLQAQKEKKLARKKIFYHWLSTFSLEIEICF